MKSAAKYFLLPLLFLMVWKANAKVEWSEPKVVPEKLTRKDRRVMRFSGETKPGAIVRIRKNKLKLYLDNGRTRWAGIPQKNKVQFPVVADRNGRFSFDLYLPTVAVEIPIQVKDGKRWRPFTLNFRVPDKGRVSDFEAMEESFRAREKTASGIDKGDNYYSRKNDHGQMIQDRGGKNGKMHSKMQAWGGLGISYFDTSIEASGGGTTVSSSGSTLVIPTFRFGLDWDYSKKILLKGAIRSTSGSTDSISGGSAPVNGKDFKWVEAQTSAVWFSDMLKMKSGRLGFDFGLQMQTLPFYRERANTINYLYMDNTLWNLGMGVFFQKRNNKSWNYEMYARYLYPLTSGDAFDIESSFPLLFEFGGGIQKQLTQSLAFGIFGQLHYFSMDVKYTNNAISVASDLNLMLLTVDCRLIASF